MTDILELTRTWLDVFPEGRFEKFPGEISPDLVLHLPYLPEGLPKEIRGLDNIKAALRATENVRGPITLTNEKMYRTDDPEIVIATANGSAKLHNGGLYENSYVFITRIRDGVVIEHTEYLNPLAMGSMRDPQEAG